MAIARQNKQLLVTHTHPRSHLDGRVDGGLQQRADRVALAARVVKVAHEQADAACLC
jgi:hypothetical protein